MSLEDLVDCTIFLGSMSDYGAINQVWADAFLSPPGTASMRSWPRRVARTLHAHHARTHNSGAVAVI